MTAPPIHDFYTHLMVKRSKQRGEVRLSARFNADHPETLVVDCRDGEVWPLPRWWLLEARRGEVGETVSLTGHGWHAVARRWNPGSVRLELFHEGRHPFDAFVSVEEVDRLDGLLSAIVLARVEDLLSVCDWDAEAANLPRVSSLCPTCSAGGLNPRCPNPGCRAENDRADAALDRLIASTED